MECDKNLFLEMSQDQMKKLDEVLQSEQAKALLQETSSKLFVDTVKTVALDEEHATIPSNLETISSLSDLENLDLDHSNPTDLFPVSNDEYVENLASGILPETLDDQALEMEIVLLDHCYSLNPTESSRDQMPAEEINATEIVTEDKEEEIEDATRKEFDNNTTPIRRSLRQIEKVEREQLEKIKAENAELQRREKEEMERLKIQKEVELKQKDEEKEKNFQDLIVQSREQDEPSREPSVKGESVTPNTSLSDALKNESEEAIMHDFCEADIKIDNTKETKKKLRNRRTKSEMNDDDVTPKDSANGNLNVQKSEKIKGRRKKAKLQVQGNIDNNSSSESENVASCEDEKEKEISSSTNKTLKNKVSKSIVDRKRRMSSPKKRCKVDTVSEDLIIEAIGKNNDFKTHRRTLKNNNVFSSDNKTINKVVQGTCARKNAHSVTDEKQPIEFSSSRHKFRKRSDSVSSEKHCRGEDDSKLHKKRSSSDRERKRSVSFCEDKDTDPNSSQSFEMKAEKPKTVRQPRKSIRRESHNSGVELFEPALFSQPDVMVKIKCLESMERKDDFTKKNCFDDMDGTESVEKLSSKDTDEKHGVMENVENKSQFQTVNNCKKELSLTSNHGSLNVDTKTMIVKNDRENPFKSGKLDKKGEFILKSEAMLSTSEKFLNNSSEILEVYHDSCLDVKSDCQEEKLNTKLPIPAENKCFVTFPASDIVTCEKSGLPSTEVENRLPVEGFCDAPETIADIEEALKAEIPNEFLEMLTMGTMPSSVVLAKPITSKSNACIIPERKSPRNLQRSKRTRYGDSPTSVMEDKKMIKDKSKKSIDSPRKSKRNVFTSVKEMKVPEIDDENEEDKESESSDDPEDSDWSSEDDPEKLWCLCRKPHNHRFMIQCDSCQEWFHGSCVGVSRQQGRQLEKQKKEWKCPHCIAVETTHKPHQVPTINVSKHAAEKQETIHEDIELKKIRSERKKSEILVKSSPTKKLSDPPLKREKERKPDGEKFHAINKNEMRKLKEETGNVMINDKIKTKTTLTDKMDRVDKSKVLQVKEKVTYDKDKHSKLKPTSEKQHLFPSSEKVTSKNDQNSINKATKLLSDALVAKRNTPSHKDSKLTKSNLSKKNQCLVCSKPSHPNASYCSDTCLEKHVIESLKSIQEHEGPAKAMSDMITRKVVVLDRSSGQLINGPSAPTQGEVLSWLKEHPTYEILYPNPPNSTKKEKKTQPVVEQKESQEEVGPESIRFNVRKTLKNTLESRCKNANDAILPEDEVRKIAIRIEEELYKLFKDTGTRYKSKYRSLMFNIKDPRNQGLFRKILKGKIPADRLVRMTTDELASVELAKWREKENQHVLDMIKREQLEQQHQAATVHITKKTHKGEVEIEDESGVAIEESFPKLSQKATDDSAELANQEVQKDSTNNHRSHLFDLNCKICTGKVAPPPAEEPLPKKMRVAHSISMDYSSSSASDTVEKNVSRIVGGEPPSPPLDNTDDSADREPSSTVSIGSPDSETMPRHSSGKTMSSVWKGFIFMQEVAKFVTSAYKVSGPTDFLFQDIPDTIQVCGRIIPDQVWDYLSKIKQSGNKELTVIRFQAANEEENHLYTQFYSYLHTRKRYGVVSGYSKMIKDFYILPLAGYNPVPTVLMPFDGPGLDAVRTHLLLGVIVRHRTRPLSSTSLPSPPLEEEGDICEGSYTPPIERDSYTPPLPAIASPDQVTISSSSLAYYPSRELKSSSSFAEGFDKAIPSYFPSSKENALKRPLEEELSYERSFTPPIESMPKMEDNSFCAKDEDSCLPYDPGEYISGTQSPTSKNIRDEQPSVYNSYTGNTTITNLIKRLTENSCASNNSAISTPTCLKDYEGNQNVYFNKRPKDSDNSNSQSGDFEDNDNNITSMSPMSPDDHVMNAQSPPESPEVENSLQCMNNSGMSSFLDLPQNLQDILNTVKYEQEKIEKAANTDFDQRYFPSFPVESRLDSDASDRSAADIDYRSQSSSQEGSPPPYDKNTNIILRPSDPRIKIRTSFDETVPGMNSVTDATKSSLSSMSASELVERAQKQLEEMEASESTITSHVETDPGSNQNTLGFAPQYHDKLWHSMSEPPPPGIDPTDLSHVDSIAYSNKSAAGDASLPSVDHVITPPYPPLSGLPESHSLGPTYLPPIIPNTMQPPPNFVPPQHPRIEAYQNQPPVTVLKQFPPSLPPNVPPPTFPPPPLALPPPKTIASQPPPIWPPPGHPPVDVDWRTRPSHWEDHWGDWDMRPMAEGDRNRPHTDYFEEHPQQTYWDDEREHLNWHHGRNRSHRQGWRDRDLEHDRNYRWDRNHQGDNSNHWNMRPRRGNRRNDHWRGNRRNFNHRQPH